MKNPQQSSSEDAPKNANDVKQQPEYKPEDFDKLIEERLEKREQLKKDQSNLTIVQQKLQERFGNNYPNILTEIRNTLDLTAEDINNLAKKSPTAFFRTLGLDQEKQETFQAPPRSGQRSDNFSPSTTKRTWSYYQNLKKQNPKIYYDPKIIAQMHRDRVELGDAFEDGDFNAL